MRALILTSLALPLAYSITSSVALAQSSLPAPPVTQTAQTSPSAAIESTTDYASAVWVPAAPGNFQPANRPQSRSIDMVIVHDIEGLDTDALAIFQRVGAKVSSHYVVGVDGIVYQMVREHDVAWHAGNSDINQRSVGIETQGYAYRPGFFSGAIYEAEAKLVRDITNRYNIPRDRIHIIGHAEVPNPRDPTLFGGVSGHTDPGPYWDWSTFMTLVRNDAHVQSAEIPSTIHPGEKLPVAITLQNTGDDVWAANKALNPRLGLQADAPIIFLGTAQGAPSALSSSGSWMSPQYADVLKTADVAPGALARFEFTIQGPRTLGEVNELLRVTRVPTTAQGGIPISFGESIPLKVNVVPWDTTIPAPDVFPLASAVPSSMSVNSPAPPVARWTVKLPIGGIWEVFMAPPKPAKVRKKESFSYSINGTEGGLRSVTVDSKRAGHGSVFGGYYRFPDPNQSTPTVTVTLDRTPRGITAANVGSLRFVGPFPNEPGQMPDVRSARG